LTEQARKLTWTSLPFITTSGLDVNYLALWNK
jgi:hypothetical protein